MHFRQPGRWRRRRRAGQSRSHWVCHRHEVPAKYPWANSRRSAVVSTRAWRLLQTLLLMVVAVKLHSLPYRNFLRRKRESCIVLGLSSTVFFFSPSIATRFRCLSLVSCDTIITLAHTLYCTVQKCANHLFQPTLLCFLSLSVCCFRVTFFRRH